jgi:hypothetical protein
VDSVCVGDETKQCPMSAAQGVAYDGTSRARCLAIVRPAFVPRKTRRRQENDGIGWSIEAAGQEPDSGIAAGSKIGPENTLKVETRVQIPLGLQMENPMVSGLF